MPDDYAYPLMINGVAVVSAPDEIDIVNAEQLRTTLREAGSRGHATVVLDMTGTRFCDSEGFSVLIGAHKWALAEGGGVQLVIPGQQPRFPGLPRGRAGPLHPPVRQRGTGPAPRACHREPASAGRRPSPARVVCAAAGGLDWTDTVPYRKIRGRRSSKPRPGAEWTLAA